MIRSQVSRIRTWTGLYRFLKKFCRDNDIRLEEEDHVLGFVLPVRGNNLNSIIHIKPTLSIRSKCMILLHELGHIYSRYDNGTYYFSYTILNMNSEVEASEFMKEVILSTKIDLTHGDKTLLGIYSSENG